MIEYERYYSNANGNIYRIWEQRGPIAVLINITKAEVLHRYVVAVGFHEEVDSWGSGKYFKTRAEAEKYFDKIK